MKILSNKFLVGLIIVLVLFLAIDIFLGWRWFKLKQQKQITLQNKIKVTSLIPSYKLEIADDQQLNSLLEEIGFWQENAIAVNLRNSSPKITAKSLLIRLVPKVEDNWWRQMTNAEETVASVGTEVMPNGEVKINFFAWDKILEDKENRNQRTSDLFMQGLYGVCFKCRQETSDGLKDYSERMLAFVKKYHQKYPNLLKIIID